MEGVGDRTPTLTEIAQDMSVTAIRIERSVDQLVKRAVSQTLIKAHKHSLRPFPKKRNIGKLPVQK